VPELHRLPRFVDSDRSGPQASMSMSKIKTDGRQLLFDETSAAGCSASPGDRRPVKREST